VIKIIFFDKINYSMVAVGQLTFLNYCQSEQVIMKHRNGIVLMIFLWH